MGFCMLWWVDRELDLDLTVDTVGAECYFLIGQRVRFNTLFGAFIRLTRALEEHYIPVFSYPSGRNRSVGVPGKGVVIGGTCV